ncbi:MAG: InlB B-repeat-containing protein [Clostridia bacterium]|nr:InlB B-repeat-containing protein [Clostridia bacterium]
MRKGIKTFATVLATLLFFGGVTARQENVKPFEHTNGEMPVVAFSETTTPTYDKTKYYLITLYYGDEVVYEYARKGIRPNFTLKSIADYFPDWNKDKNETFLGWFTGVDGAGAQYREKDLSIVSDVTLYAKIEKKETVSVTLYDGEEALLQKLFVKGDSYTLSELNVSAPEKYGYAFDGWKDANGEPVLENTLFTATENKAFYTSYTVGKPHGGSSSLWGDGGLHIYLEFTPEVYRSEGKLKIEFDQEEQERMVSDGEAVEIEGVTYYKYSFSLNPKDYDKEWKIAFVLDTGIGFSFSYSVKEYIETLLLAEGYEEEKPLARALQTYCEAAKGYFYGSSVTDIDGVTAQTLYSYASTAVGSHEGVTTLGATLSLETQTAIRIYFTAVEAPICKIDGKRKTPQSFYQDGQTIFYLEIADLYAQDLDKVYLIEIGNVEIHYSGYSYAYEVLISSDDATLCTLAKALYLYGEAATAYFE